ncbi:hypothetical protein Gotri_014229, partial [Gossypium trilobum]|nr:hypothetical protein [Gossypium trilobum]
MLMIYLTSVMAGMQIHIDSLITDRNSPFYDDINAAGPMYAKSKCCNNHPELGKCVPGEDDNPDKDGKCWNY